MRLDRNINGSGRGKYGLVNNRELQQYADRAAAAAKAARMVDVARYDEADVEAMKVMNAIKMLEDFGILDWGAEGTESEFFVIKLRDRAAHAGLTSYATVAGMTDPEYAKDVRALSDRAGPYSPFCKMPD